MGPDVIARDDELAAVEAFLDPAGDRARALVLEGPAGIGKSTLWSAGVAAARARFRHVLVSQPAESERWFANVVLADLFADTPRDLIAALPGPRRRAFEAALLLGEEADAPADPRALGAAVLAILGALAAEGPLVLAIDDDQWADASSVAALDFALRRLGHEPIRLLLARRVGVGGTDGSRLDLALDVAGEVGRSDRVEVGPLSIGAIQLLLRSRLGITMSRPNLIRLAEASGGNAFFALELARAQPAAGAPPAALVVPESLERLLRARLDGVDDATRRGLLLLAAHGRASLDLLRRLRVEPGVIDGAAATDLLEASTGVVRFTHPLLASTVYQQASAAERRAAHLDLAVAADDPVSRARHLALATTVPEDEVAHELEAAAMLARTRGLPLVAAELAEQAMRLTPPGRTDDSLRRGSLAARAHLAAGEPDRARAIVSAQLAEAPMGPRRAEALILVSELEEPGPAVALLEQALEEASGHAILEGMVHTALAGHGRFLHGRDWAEDHVRAALAVAERLGDDLLPPRALAVLSELRFEDGDPEAFEMALEAHRQALAADDPDAIRTTTWAVGHQLTHSKRIDEARAWFERALADADRDELLRALSLWYLAFVELWAGRWDVAWAHAEEAADIDRQYGIETPQDHLPQALIALHRGQLTLAREHSRRALALAEGMLLPAHLAVLGTADLWSGRVEEALATLAAAADATTRRGFREPGMTSGRAEHVEALLQLGRIGEAERLIAAWELAATGRWRDWVRAEVVRSRGLLAAARADLDDAVEQLEDAIRRHENVGDTFGKGRALLALGRVRRRRRQKRLAREALEAARAVFETLGAAGFAETARRELGQLGGRRRVERLSPSERRVAELVAEGRSNREVAALLFLAERTVASHLTHAYAKLGIRSRTELVRRLADEQAAVLGASPPPSEATTPTTGEPGKVPTS